MRRQICTLGFLLFSLTATEGSVRADEAFHPQAQTERGSVTVPPVGGVSYETAWSSAGYDHFQARVFVAWQDEGRQSQILFEGILDNPPAQVRSVDSRLCISVKYCQRYQDECPVWSVLYSYDQEVKRFFETAREQGTCRHVAKGRPGSNERGIDSEAATR